MSQTFFTPVETFLGGYLLHMSTAGLLEDTGTVLGVSGILDGVLYGSTTKSINGSSQIKGNITKAQKRNSKEHGGTDLVDKYWRLAVVGGILLAPMTAGLLDISPKGDATLFGGAVLSWGILELQMGLTRLAIAGLLVGLGSRLGSGCTSGHFLCGASRLSPRSITATAIFFPIAMLTAYLFPVASSVPFLDALTPASFKPILPQITSVSSLLLPLVISRASRQALRRILSPSSPASFRLLPYALSGWTFGMGLLMSGMANPLKVLSFLRISPLQLWDPSLAMVFLGGVIPNAIAYAQLKPKARKEEPSVSPTPYYSWAKWQVPTRTDIDWKLVVGAAVFGLGWGLGGVCPGPAIVGASSVLWEQGLTLVKGTVGKGLIVFLLSMAAGMRIGRTL